MKGEREDQLKGDEAKKQKPCPHTHTPDAHTRLHVEEAEDKLVQATETAIGLMKAVLENVCDLVRC